MTIEQIHEDFDLLDDWEDRYRYVIELGRTLPELPADERVEANKVRGCVSQVWLATKISSDCDAENPKLHFTGDSDAHIVRGLVAILFAIFQDKSASEILKIDAPQVFDSLGLKEHLTPQRSNGLASMMTRIREDAARALQAA